MWKAGRMDHNARPASPTNPPAAHDTPPGAKAPTSDGRAPDVNAEADIDTNVADAAQLAREPRWRGRKVALGAFAVLTVLAVAALVSVAPTAWQIMRERDTTVETPQRIDGLVRDDSDGAKGTSDALATALSAGVPIDRRVGAVYSDGGDRARSIIVIGGTGLQLSPEKQLDTLLGLFQDNLGGVEGTVRIPAGPLGGIMKCGTTQTEDGAMAVCGWADHGCVVIALFPHRTIDESGELLRRIRSAIQHRAS